MKESPEEYIVRIRNEEHFTIEGIPFTYKETGEAEMAREEGEFIGLVDLLQGRFADLIAGGITIRELRAVWSPNRDKVFVVLNDDPIWAQEGNVVYQHDSIADITRGGLYVGVGRDIPSGVQDLRDKLSVKDITAEWHTPSNDDVQIEARAFPRPTIVSSKGTRPE